MYLKHIGWKMHDVVILQPNFLGKTASFNRHFTIQHLTRSVSTRFKIFSNKKFVAMS